MAERLTLLAILAHPDDESLGVGGTLAKYADEGCDVHLVTATRGERGRFGDAQERPSLSVVGETREAELRAAAAVLRIKTVTFLDYIDGDLDKADPAEAIARISRCIREHRPNVIITFAPEGGYGHPDHIAISQFALAAVVNAADAAYAGSTSEGVTGSAHRVDKGYFMSWTEPKWKAYTAAFKELKITVDGVERQASPWPAWGITTAIDTSAYWKTVWKAVQCHRTQMAIYHKLADLAEEHHRAIWGSQEFYRIFSTVNGGRERETDLLAGLR